MSAVEPTRKPAPRESRKPKAYAPQPRYLDLHPVVYRIAEKIGFPAITIDDNDTAYEDDGFYGSDWIIMTRNAELLQQPLIHDATSDPVEFSARVLPWTDERSDLLRILVSEEGSFLRWLQNL